MAQDRTGPWSRWDGLPGDSNILSPITSNTGGRQYDTSVVSSISQTGAQSGYLKSGLLDQRINSIDPSFYDCVYGVQGTMNTIVEQCYKDLGCCANGCCKNSDWRRKHDAALALIIIFGILVIIAVVVALIVWLFNRAKDKRQKRQLINEASGMSPAPSNTSLAQPVQGGYHFGTGPYQSPPNNGYRY